MMLKCNKSHVLIPLLLHILCFFLFPQTPQSQQGNAFSRHPSDPQQVHISLAGKDHMRVSWISEDEHSKSEVEYGTKEGEYNTTATGEHTYYDFAFLSYKSGKIHDVVIGPLSPATTYFYRCGGSGPEFSFKTPPSKLPIEFAVAGDVGQDEWAESTLKLIDSKDYDVFLLPGDLSYADFFQQRWDSFGRFVEPYASKRPWMVTAGNHKIERLRPIEPQPFKAYNARWPMPYKESGSTSNLYYSFELPSIHIIMLGSYTDFDAHSDQYKWLQSDLAKIDRMRTPWVIALLHAPWYNTNEAHQGGGESMRQAMEELLYKARVDLVLAGHVHAYERFTRIYDDKADLCGPVYMTVGCGGRTLALNFKKPQNPLSLYREPSFGLGRLRIVNETHAHWSWRRNNDSNAFIADDDIWIKSLSSSKACRATHVAHGEM